MKHLVFLLSFTFAFSNFTFGQSDLPEITNISIDSMGDLKWTITYIEDLHGVNQEIEQFKGDKWVKITERGWGFAPTEGWDSKKKLKNSIRDSVRLKFHKGLNKYRIKVIFPSIVTSQEVQLFSKVTNDDGSVWIVGNEIIMDNKVYYEVLNNSGSKVLHGEAKKINISSLNKGSYFLYTKKETKSFVK